MAKKVNDYYAQAEVIATEIFDTDGLEVLDANNLTVNADVIHIDNSDPDNITETLVIDASAGIGHFAGGINIPAGQGLSGDVTGTLTGNVLNTDNSVIVNVGTDPAQFNGTVNGLINSTTGVNQVLNLSTTTGGSLRLAGNVIFENTSRTTFAADSEIDFEFSTVNNFPVQTDLVNDSYDINTNADEPDTLKLWTGSDDDYAAVVTKDDNTLYFVYEIITP